MNRLLKFSIFFSFIYYNYIIFTNEVARIFVEKIYMTFILFFINQSDSTIIITAVIIGLFNWGISNDKMLIGPKILISVVYIVGIIAAKEIYYELINAGGEVYIISVMAYFIGSMLMCVLMMTIDNLPKSHKEITEKKK